MKNGDSRRWEVARLEQEAEGHAGWKAPDGKKVPGTKVSCVQLADVAHGVVCGEPPTCYDCEEFYRRKRYASDEEVFDGNGTMMTFADDVVTKHIQSVVASTLPGAFCPSLSGLPVNSSRSHNSSLLPAG